MVFDNHDSRIRYYELLLYRNTLDNIPRYSLPHGMRFVFYQPGDRDAWIAIEQSAKELTSYEQGVEVWEKYYAMHEDELSRRMLFIEDADGRKIATASAYFDINTGDCSDTGWLHWVAVGRRYQGRGLSKPLICHALNVMRDMGYTSAKLSTQTTTWLACAIYLDMGFLPVPENTVSSHDGWRIIRTITNHHVLEGFKPAAPDEILA